MTNTAFYNEFFKEKGSFLDIDHSVSKERSYVSHIGFSEDNTNWEGLEVCEVGAGLGRLTHQFDQAGLIQKAHRYAIVEPSESIPALKERFDRKNIEFYRSDLSDFSISNARKFDIVICHGVTPHIDEDFTIILKQLGSLLKESGTLHVIQSFYGYPKTGSKFLWDICRKNSLAIKPLSFFSACLQVACNNRLLSGFYKKNFIFSFQKSFPKIYNQHYEYYGVSPYNIFYNYPYVIDALSRAGFHGVTFYPYSMALSATFGAGEANTLHIPAGRPFAIIGNDWSCRWVHNQLRHLGDIRCVDTLSEVRSEDIVILGHDMSLVPYHAMVDHFTKAGRIFGKDIFLFQMLLK